METDHSIGYLLSSRRTRLRETEDEVAACDDSLHHLHMTNIYPQYPHHQPSL